ncbi:MAG: hypothetical protein AAGA91_07175 [Pseudomonadota bacterium]
MQGLFRPVLVCVFLVLLSGCKLAITVPAEGYVISSSGIRDCSGPGYCEFEIRDAAYRGTFTAVPWPGYTFVEWQDGSGFLCADSTDPSCTVEMPSESAGAVIAALFRTGKLRPIFSDPEGADTYWTVPSTRWTMTAGIRSSRTGISAAPGFTDRSIEQTHLRLPSCL